MKMKVCIAVMAGIVLALPLNMFAQEKQEKSTVQLAGLRIVGPGYGANGSELQAFQESSGTTLALAVEAPKDKKIIELDDSKCSLTQFTDDRNRNLMDGIYWGSWPKTSEDGSAALIEVSSKNRPSQDASRLTAKGTLHLRVADSVQTEKIEALKLEAGTEVKVAGEEIKVLKVEKEDRYVALTFQLTDNINLDKVRFTTADGKPVDASGRNTSSDGSVVHVIYYLEMESIPETLNLEMEVWQGAETLDLPFEITAGISL
ncbi:MAG: hypothetical protein ACL93V_05150 [Candidatus Electrothrix sp. YB6]